MKAVAVVEGGALSYEDYPDPVAGPGEVVVELRAAAINRRDLLVRNPPGPAYQFDLPVIPGSDGAGIRRDTGEEVVIYPGLHWGTRRGRGRAGLADPRRPRRRHVRRAREGAGGERVPEAGAASRGRRRRRSRSPR